MTSDGKVVRSAAMINGYGQNEGTVQVWYSPSSRCVWAAMASSYGVACDPGVDGCGWASVVRNDGRTESCSFVAGGKKCVTAAINDANKLSYATGSIDTGTVYVVARAASY